MKSKVTKFFKKWEKKTLFNYNSLIFFFYLWISGSNSFSCISTPTSIEHLCREPGPWLMSGDAAKSGELLGGVDRRSAIVYLHVIFTIWIVVSQMSLNFSAFPSYQSCKRRFDCYCVEYKMHIEPDPPQTHTYSRCRCKIETIPWELYNKYNVS